MSQFPAEPDAGAKPETKPPAGASAKVLFEGIPAAARAASPLERLEYLKRELAEHNKRIAAAGAEIACIGELASKISSRIAMLTDPEQPLARASVDAERVEQHVVAIAARIERLLAEDLRLAPMDAMAASLERRAPEALAQLERIGGELDAQTARIAGAATEVTRVENLAGALQDRVARLTDAEHSLAETDSVIVRLEERIAGTTAKLAEAGSAAAAQNDRLKADGAEVLRVSQSVTGLEIRLEKLKAQIEQTTIEISAQSKQIESAGAEATRVRNGVSALESRVAQLASSQRSVERAGSSLDAIEHRVAGAADRLDRLSTATREVERELQQLQKQHKSLAASARKVVRQQIATNALGLMRPIRPWLLGAIAVVVLAIGGVVLRRSLMPPQAQARSSEATAPAALLPSRPLPFIVAPMRGPAAASAMRVVGTTGARKTPAVGKTLPVGKTPAVARAPQKITVEKAAPAFAGSLAVDSNPVGAAVFVDRQYVGATPVVLPGLRAGSHTVWVEHEGHQRWTASVRVAADKETQVNANLQRRR